MSKSNLLLTLTGEKIEYQRLYDLTGSIGRNMTTIGAYSFTSLSSGTNYSTSSGGEYNVFLQLQTVLGTYNIIDIDFNNKIEMGALNTHTSVVSTETVSGHVELATATETNTGTDNTRAVHPAGLKSITNLLIPLTQKGVVNGVGTLDSSGHPVEKTYVTGTYTGDNAASRLINLGFTPSAVLVFASGYFTISGNQIFGGLATTGAPIVSGSGNALVVVANGFNVYYAITTVPYCTTNASPQSYTYIAFR